MGDKLLEISIRRCYGALEVVEDEVTVKTTARITITIRTRMSQSRTSDASPIQAAWVVSCSRCCNRRLFRHMYPSEVLNADTRSRTAPAFFGGEIVGFM